MKDQLILTLIVGAVAGLFGAALINLFLPDSSTRADERGRTPIVRGPVEDDGELAERLADLELQNLALLERLETLEESMSLLGSRRVVADTPAPVEAQEVDESIAALAAALRSGQGPDEFQVLVENALGEIRAQEERERAQEREQLILERVDKRLEELGEELGLTPYQVDAMRPILIEQDSKRMAITDEIREQSRDWREAREDFTELRDATIERLADVLTPDQLERYEQLENPFGRRGPGGAGRAPGGGRRR
jgi:hypothetical protein